MFCSLRWLLNSSAASSADSRVTSSLAGFVLRRSARKPTSTKSRAVAAHLGHELVAQPLERLWLVDGEAQEYDVGLRIAQRAHLIVIGVSVRSQDVELNHARCR